ALLACTKAPWELVHSPPGIQRSFTFKTFNQAMKFMNAVADECKVQRHHPEWANVYNKVVVRWTTHNPKGISEKDVYMAKWCDDAGERFG
ncbi:transcriptional coactivator/pterin dehydratase, partial [Peziza echinospora]